MNKNYHNEKHTKPIHDYFRHFSNLNIRYIPNLGNAGDAMIATATAQMFNKYNIIYDTIDPKKSLDENFSKKDIVFCGGGGAFISQSKKQMVRKFIQKKSQFCKSLNFITSYSHRQ